MDSTVHVRRLLNAEYCDGGIQQVLQSLEQTVYTPDDLDWKGDCRGATVSASQAHDEA
jgi:hypothetical protein